MDLESREFNRIGRSGLAVTFELSQTWSALGRVTKTPPYTPTLTPDGLSERYKCCAVAYGGPTSRL